jgi:acetyl-CoA C-acetyltransferase
MAVYISSVGMTKFGIHNKSLAELIIEAASKAISSLPSKKKNFDALFVAAMNPSEITDEDNIAALMADELGLIPIPAFRIENAPASGSTAIHQAFFAVSSGFYNRVLVVAGEKMSAKSTKELSKLIAKLTPLDERNLGITVPALTALMARRYMYEYDLTREDLALVAVKSHYNASMNPYAHFQKGISAEDVLSSPMVSDPLRLYDCAPISDGACAAVVTSEKGEVEIVGLGHEADTLYFQHRDVFSSFPATQKAANKAYSMARMTQKEMDVVETHDAFTILELINPEDLGFFEGGKSIDALKEGVTGLGGDLPINPSGGLKAKGHPVGATGLAQICELFWQINGEAGNRQVDNVKVGLAHNIGGFGNNAAVTILKEAL